MACLLKQQLMPLSSPRHPHAVLQPTLPSVHYDIIKVSSSNKKLSSKPLGHGHSIFALKASQGNYGIAPADDDNQNGVSLGTMKLPSNIDFPRFETLLFQWGNSLCQGANLPLPVPLKVDKITGGIRLGFITIGDGETEVVVYIDCLVFPETDGSGPIFRAIRKGPLKDRSPPGEPRIMRSLLEALKKSIELARV